MRNRSAVACMAFVALLAVTPAFAQSEGVLGRGEAVVTVLPKHEGTLPPSVANQDLAVKVDGKNAKVTKWAPFVSPDNRLELVLLIATSARSGLGGRNNCCSLSCNGDGIARDGGHICIARGVGEGTRGGGGGSVQGESRGTVGLRGYAEGAKLWFLSGDCQYFGYIGCAVIARCSLGDCDGGGSYSGESDDII